MDRNYYLIHGVRLPKLPDGIENHDELRDRHVVELEPLGSSTECVVGAVLWVNDGGPWDVAEAMVLLADLATDLPELVESWMGDGERVDLLIEQYV